MERYPILALILRYGGVGSSLLALLAAATAIAAGYDALGAYVYPIGAVIAGVVWVLARSYVELVTIVTEMLVPR